MWTLNSEFDLQNIQIIQMSLNETFNLRLINNDKKLTTITLMLFVINDLTSGCSLGLP